MAAQGVNSLSCGRGSYTNSWEQPAKKQWARNLFWDWSEICSGNLGLSVPNYAKSCSVVLNFITFSVATCLFTLPNRKSHETSKYEVHKSRIVLVEEGAAAPRVARPNTVCKPLD